MANAFDIDDYVKPQPAVDAPAPSKPGLGARIQKAVGTAESGFKFGPGPEKWLRPIAKTAAGGALLSAPIAAGTEQLARGGWGLYKDGFNASDALRAGVGAGAFLSPHMRAVATGMSAADFVPDSWYDRLLRGIGLIKDIDPLSPAFRSRVDSAGGTADAYEKSLALGAPKPETAATSGEIPAPAPVAAAPVAIPTASPENAVVPTRGTGFIRNNVTGAVTSINSSGAGLGIRPERYSPTTAAGGFFQAGADLRRIANDNTRATAQSKLLIDALTKGAGIRRDNAAASELELRTAEAARAKTDGATPAEVASILAGRASGDKYTGFPTIAGDKIDVLNRSTGAVLRKTPAPGDVAKVAQDRNTGKYYILDSTGKPVREASSTEIAQLKK